MIKDIKWFIVSAIIILISSLVIISQMGAYLIVDHNLFKADAIVLLNGCLERKPPEAADVFLSGYADLIITPQAHTDGTQRAVSILIDKGVPEDRIIILPSQIRSTQDEAVAVSDYLAQRTDINSFILVTSSYHTRRSVIIFSRALKSLDRDVVIISRASRYDSFQSERWWEDPQSTSTIKLEYQKIFYYYYLELFDGNEEPLNKVLQFFNKMIQIK